MKTVKAIFENGGFRPRGPVELPEHAEVEFEPRPVKADRAEKIALAEVYSALAERFNSGVTDTAARHDEHQP
jgi:predicted DNA-binding antitoxin AbrB/MazE fold protein